MVESVAMVLRTFAFFLVAAFASGACASEAIPNAPTSGVSAAVKQPHVTAELISESTTLKIGQPFDVILHLHMDEGWHTYWINPGDAGLATAIKWTLPPGIQAAGPIEWPTPEIHAMGPLATYGYAGDAYLLTKMTPIPALAGYLPKKLELKAHASWLVCQEECVPGQADLSVTMDFVPVPAKPVVDTAREEFFKAARLRLPVANMRWDVEAGIGSLAGTPSLALDLALKNKAGQAPSKPGHLFFFPEQQNALSNKTEETRLGSRNEISPDWSIISSVAQNGKAPDTMSGIVVSDEPLIGAAKSVYLAPFSTKSSHTPDLAKARPVTGQTTAQSALSNTAPKPAPTLIAVLILAFGGGLILNLMPCVLPVLSLKVFSLIKHSGEGTGGAWKQGVAFSLGVLVSFWILAGLLIAFEAAGKHLGWGFQLQSPGFVLALTFLFFLLALNLLGVFEIGASLVGLDAKATSSFGGLPSSFANGALATLAATPCTAPFMGSAVGFAAQQPAAISLLVFTVLALGMASPYLALTIVPGAMRLVPKPGAWMETLKQFMGFLLMGTVIFLVYVFAALTGQDSVPMLLGALLLTAVAAWIFGRVNSPIHDFGTKAGWMIVALVLFAAAVGEGIKLSHHKPGAMAQEEGWTPWSTEAVQKALAQGRPVFVDFTAAWCISCKANEQVAIDIDSTKKIFAAKNVVLLRGDWTQADPKISDALLQYKRDGVPLYLVYSPKEPNAPQVLPEVLTPGIVHDALQKLP